MSFLLAIKPLLQHVVDIVFPEVLQNLFIDGALEQGELVYVGVDVPVCGEYRQHRPSKRGELQVYLALRLPDVNDDVHEPVEVHVLVGEPALQIPRVGDGALPVQVRVQLHLGGVPHQLVVAG